MLAVPAGATLRWRVIGHGTSPGAPVAAPVAYVALSRKAARRFSGRLGGGARVLSRLDFSKNAVVAIFGEFGCQDSLVKISSILQRGASLAVRLVQGVPPPGTVQCAAIFGTYRMLALPRSSLRAPYPTRATVTLARA